MIQESGQVWKNGNGSLAQMPNSMQETALTTPSKPVLTKVVSNTPGRLRVRVAHTHRQPDKMQRLATALEARPDIKAVRTNVPNGSITIHYDHHNVELENVFATLWDVGMIFADITGGKSEVAADVSNTVVDLNKRVNQATNGVVDLRFLFPLALASLSLRQLIVKGLQLEIIPWYVLAWYAFDSFLKLHANAQPQSSNE